MKSKLQSSLQWGKRFVMTAGKDSIDPHSVAKTTAINLTQEFLSIIFQGRLMVKEMIPRV